MDMLFVVVLYFCRTFVLVYNHVHAYLPPPPPQQAKYSIIHVIVNRIEYYCNNALFVSE